jgi:hypothetical protein
MLGSRGFGEKIIDTQTPLDGRAGPIQPFFAQFEQPQPKVHHGRAPHARRVDVESLPGSRRRFARTGKRRFLVRRHGRRSQGDE